MTNKKLLKKTYILYLDNIDAGAENLGLDVEIFYEHFNPKHNAKLNKKLAKQLSCFCSMGYIAIKVQQEPFYCKYIEFSPLMFYDVRQTKDKIISGILTITAALSGTLLGFILNNSCTRQNETKQSPQATAYYCTYYSVEYDEPSISHIL